MGGVPPVTALAQAGYRASHSPAAAARSGRLPRRAQPISIRGVERGDGIEDQGFVEGQPPVGDGVAPEVSTTLDRAAEFQYHSEEFDPEAASPDAEWSIRCIDVHKRLGGIPVLNGLNVAIPDNTITVVLGPSGTGKSVLIKHLIGLMFPDSGEILVHGQSVPSLTMPQLLAMRRRIGVLFQDGALFGSMSVFDNVAFPLRQHTDMSESQISERRQRSGWPTSACWTRCDDAAVAALRRDAQARRASRARW